MAGGYEGVGVEESAEIGGVISGGQIIQFCLIVVDIATIAQRIVYTEGGCHCAGGAQKVAPGIVNIAYHLFTRAIQNADYITLNVGNIIVDSIIISFPLY